MTKTYTRHKKWVAIIFAILVALWVWQGWRGPVITGYIVERAELVQQVVATGRVVSNSRTQIGSEITAVVTKRHVREGDIVKQGDILVSLRADNLEARAREAQAALDLLQTSQRPQALASRARAESQLAQSKRELERRQSLLASRAVPKEDVEQAANAVDTAQAAARQARLGAESLAPGGAQEKILQERLQAALADLEKTTVRAGRDGIVLTRNVEPGDLVQPGRVLFTLSSTTDTELLVPVDERNLGLLATGQHAIAITDAWPDRPFDAVITSIAPAVDPERGTVDVRLAPDPAAGFLRQDLTVTVTITTGTRGSAVVVPNDVLYRDASGQPYVWTVSGNMLRITPVQTGLRGQTLTEIVAGLSQNDRVASISGKSIKEGQRVRLEPQPMPGLNSPRDVSTRGETPMKFN